MATGCFTALKDCLPWFDFSDPYEPMCGCANLQIEKSGLFSVPENSTVCLMFPSWLCKFFTGAADLFLTPFLLVIHFVRIYLFPAVTTTVFHLIERFICTLNCCSFGFLDVFYPPNDRSVGVKDNIKPHTCENLDLWHRGIFYVLCGCLGRNKIEWVRAKDLSESDDSKVSLFKGDVEAEDIGQGNLGDCWLLASLAAIAERHPRLIKEAFLTGRTSLCGYYKLKLYDTVNGTPRWRVITIDDYIPVKAGSKSPMFSQPNNNELWVLLMEKAFSKILGSYQGLTGGFSRFPFSALTGNDCVEYEWTGHCYSLTNTTGRYENQKDRGAENDRDAPKELLIENMHNVLSHGLKHDMIATVAVNNAVDGLVSHHMYTVLNACTTKNGEVKLVQMRNPWGREGEWTGPYSDKDSKTLGWKPDSGFVVDLLGVGKRGVDHASTDDGLFWMPLDDLARRAHGLFCLCAVSDSMASMRLDMHEDMGECGPCYGCMEGGCSFCLKCEGTKALWCPQQRSTASMVNSFSKGNSLADLLGCDSPC